jgi:hypothetical protein
MAHSASQSFDLERVWRPSVMAVLRAARGEGVRIEETARRAGGAIRPADKAIQKRVGDFTEVRMDDGAIVAYHEAKIEKEKRAGNLFIETWSNFSPEGERAKEGWFTSCQADVLWYGFIDTLELFEIPWPALQTWLLAPHPTRAHPLGVGKLARIDTYRERAQTQVRQRNTTVGRLVPLADLQAAGLVAAVHRLETP